MLRWEAFQLLHRVFCCIYLIMCSRQMNVIYLFALLFHVLTYCWKGTWMRRLLIDRFDSMGIDVFVIATFSYMGTLTTSLQLRSVHTERPHYRDCNKVTLTDRMEVQPLLFVTAPIKKIKGANRPYYGDGVFRCGQTLICAWTGNTFLDVSEQTFSTGLLSD